MELDTTSSHETPSRGTSLKVVIIGAGPSGLLLAHYLLEKGAGRFRVSLHDAKEDPRETIKQPPTPRR
jgi:cation diffusion facilitator CzcD-associated flavoprotein CzcO